MFLKDKSLHKNLSIVLGGVGIAQLIPFLFSFLIARLYSPEQFGIFGLLLSITGPLSVIVCLRYELAIALPKDENESLGLVKLGWIIAFLLSLISILAIFVYSLFVIDFQYSSLYFIVPPFIIFVAVGQTINYWLQRKEQFKKIAFLKIIQTSSISILTVLFGYFFLKDGLVLGYILGWLILAFVSFFILFRAKSFSQKASSNLVLLMKKYKDYPLYNAFPALLQAVCISIPLWIAQKYFSTNDVGFFNLTRQLLLVITGIGIPAFTQIYYQRSVAALHQNKEQFTEFKKFFSILLVLSVIAVIILFFFGNELFIILYGSNWSPSGKIASILIFSTSLQLIVFPLATVLNTIQKIKIASLWQILYFLSLITLYFFKFKSFNSFLKVYIVVESSMLIVYFLTIYLLVKKHDYSIVNKKHE